MKIHNLCKKFGNHTIFQNFNIDFEENKVTYLMGKSGIGKTTLLRIISGLDKDFEGEVNFNGRLSYVFQEPRLFPNLTVLDNLKIVNSNPKYDANKILELVLLNGCERMLPSALSGGMKMRLSIARALYYDPDIVLMDEPFAALDEETREKIAENTFKLLKGKTVIVVSHNSDDASKYADKIITI